MGVGRREMSHKSTSTEESQKLLSTPVSGSHEMSRDLHRAFFFFPLLHPHINASLMCHAFSPLLLPRV